VNGLNLNHSDLDPKLHGTTVAALNEAIPNARK